MPRGSGATSRACSAYARQFLDMMQKPDVDHITGLSPAISIEQKTTSKNPRSTVGTVTEIYDYLRLLFARVGMPYSPATGLPIEAQQISQMVDITMALPEGTRAYLLAPIVRDRKGEYRKEFQDLRSRASSGSRSTASSTTSTPRRSSTRSTATTSTWWSTASWCARGWRRGWPISLRTALDLADGIAILETAPAAEEPEGARSRGGSPSRRSSPARSPASPSPRSSRGCSRSTPRSAPARPATGSGSSCSSTRG